MNNIVYPNWQTFAYKYQGQEEDAFEDLARMLFRKEMGIQYGIFQRINHTGNETDVIEKDGNIIGFQSKYFPAIVDAFAVVGREVEIKKKDKKNFGKVESAFLKDNTDVYDVTFQTEKSIKIKIEVDTCPPLNFKTEQKLLLQPHSFMTRCFTLPDLFAGKMHALVYRAWKNRVKGRDWYDFEWYVRNNVPLDFTHLAERCKQFNNEEITPDLFKEKLIERLSTADMKQVKADVLPFVRNPKELDIWSNDYFVQLAKMNRVE